MGSTWICLCLNVVLPALLRSVRSVRSVRTVAALSPNELQLSHFILFRLTNSKKKVHEVHKDPLFLFGTKNKTER